MPRLRKPRDRAMEPQREALVSPTLVAPRPYYNKRLIFMEAHYERDDIDAPEDRCACGGTWPCAERKEGVNWPPNLETK